MKRLLIVYASQSAGTARMKNALLAGARGEPGVEVLCLRAADALAQDVLDADGYVFGTPENFGALAGAMKDFFDRVYGACEERVQGRPYALFVNAGNDGSGAVRQLERIVTGLRLKPAAPPLLAVKAITPETLDACEELGAAMAAGLALGVL